MPQVNLTEPQIIALAAGLKMALDADENLPLMADALGVEYPAMPGGLRRRLLEVWGIASALAQEHVDIEAT